MAQSLVVKGLLGVAGLLMASPSFAFGGALRVPDEYPTIQAAVDDAEAGDVIWVKSGEYCGASIDKPVHLIAHGRATIVGCETGPMLSGALRVGFLLDGSNGSSPASGTTIRGFRFDGAGVSNANLEPLAFGILARFASNIAVVHNRFEGTVQAITNTAGDRWLISHNRVEDLTVLDCTRFCTGGDGIVVQSARGTLAVGGDGANPVNRPEHNLIQHNWVSGSIPDNFDVFGYAGVLVLAADWTAILHNKLSIPDNPTAEAPGQGVLITNVCCGNFTPVLPGSRNTWLGWNDARRSEDGFVVEGTGGQNTQGFIPFHNKGTLIVEGVEVEQQKPHRFPHIKRWKDRWM